MLPSARAFLDDDDRISLTKVIAASDEGRPWRDVAVAGDAAVIHSFYAVQTRAGHGLDIVRSFADCPRRNEASVYTCARCPHLYEGSARQTGRPGIGPAAQTS